MWPSDRRCICACAKKRFCTLGASGRFCCDQRLPHCRRWKKERISLVHCRHPLNNYCWYCKTSHSVQVLCATGYRTFIEPSGGKSTWLATLVLTGNCLLLIALSSTCYDSSLCSLSQYCSCLEYSLKTRTFLFGELLNNLKGFRKRFVLVTWLWGLKCRALFALVISRRLGLMHVHFNAYLDYTRGPYSAHCL